MLGSRISYVGEYGWELHVPADQAGHLWDLLWEAGQPHGLVPAGIGVYGTTARLEKGYRAFGAELTPEYNPVEAGMARPKVKPEPFIGKEAYLAARAARPRRCCARSPSTRTFPPTGPPGTCSGASRCSPWTAGAWWTRTGGPRA